MPFHNLSEDQFYTAFWEESPIPLSVVDRTGRFVAVNSAWTELLGYARSELQGRHFREVTHPADISGDEAEVARLAADPDAAGYSLVKRYIHKHGPSLWVELHVRAVRNTEQELECFAVCIVPLPVVPQIQPSTAQPGVWRLVALCFVDLVKTHPKQCIFAASLAIVAAGKIPLQPFVTVLERFFLNP